MLKTTRRDWMSRERVSFAVEVASAVHRHLPKRVAKSPRVAALASDLLLLVCRVRVAILWDYWNVDVGAASDFEPSGSSVRPSQILALINDLSNALGVLLAGPSLFIIHREMLHSNLVRELACGDGPLHPDDVLLVAVDRDDSASVPRVLTPSERAVLIGRLRALGAEIVRQCHQHHIAEALGEQCDGGDGGKTQQHRLLTLTDDCAGPLLVAVHGWLLEYPVVYCFVNASAETEACGRPSCLSGEPLRVHRLMARDAAQKDAPSHLVCSFTVPARLLDGLEAEQEEKDATDEESEMQQTPAALRGGVISRWEDRMRCRIATANEWWRDPQVTVESAAHDSISL